MSGTAKSSSGMRAAGAAPVPVTLATWDHDRAMPVLNGDVPVKGFKIEPHVLPTTQLFPIAVNEARFDVTELSLSSYMLQVSRGTSAYTAIPVFLARAFRHNGFFRPRRQWYPVAGRPEGPGCGGARISDDGRAVDAGHFEGRPWYRGDRPDLADGGAGPGRAARAPGTGCSAVVVDNPDPCGRDVAGPASGRKDRRASGAQSAACLLGRRPADRSVSCPISPLPRKTITAAPGSFRSCTFWPCARRWSRRIPICRARCLTRSALRATWR